MQVLKLFFAFLLFMSVGTSLAGGERKNEQKEIAKLAQLEKAYVAAKKAFTAKPKDAKAKKAFIDAATLYARTTMFSPALEPKAKYPKALKVYREVLKADPKNKEAKESVATIEQIYKSMGRPIPK